MTPVIRIDDEVIGELKKRAIDLGLVFEPPNATLRRVLGLDSAVIGEAAGNTIAAAPATRAGKRQRFGRFHTATPVRDTATGQVYPSKYKAGLAFVREFPNTGVKYVWYPLIRKYPGRFVEVATGQSTLETYRGSSLAERGVRK